MCAGGGRKFHNRAFRRAAEVSGRRASKDYGSPIKGRGAGNGSSLPSAEFGFPTEPCAPGRRPRKKIRGVSHVHRRAIFLPFLFHGRKRITVSTPGVERRCNPVFPLASRCVPAPARTRVCVCVCARAVRACRPRLIRLVLR